MHKAFKSRKATGLMANHTNTAPAPQFMGKICKNIYITFTEAEGEPVDGSYSMQ
jgi:hypothetical protein